MSTVTSVILTCAKSDAKRVDDAMYDNCNDAFDSFTHERAAGFSMVARLSGQQVRDALAKVEWSEPAAVRLLIQEEKDAAFSVWKLCPEQHFHQMISIDGCVRERHF